MITTTFTLPELNVTYADPTSYQAQANPGLEGRERILAAAALATQANAIEAQLTPTNGDSDGTNIICTFSNTADVLKQVLGNCSIEDLEKGVPFMGGTITLTMQTDELSSEIADELNLSEKDYGTFHSTLVCEPENWCVRADGSFAYGLTA